MRSIPVLLLAFALVSCGTTPDVPDGEPAFSLTSFSPQVWVPGTTVVIRGEGFRSGEPMSVSIVGDATPLSGGATKRVDVTATPRLAEIGVLHVDIDASFLAQAGGDGTFNGRLTVKTTRDGRPYEEAFDATIGLAVTLEPELDEAVTSAIYFGDAVTFSGANFLLGNKEGQFELIADGTFRKDGGSSSRVEAFPLPIRVDDRGHAVYVHTSEAFGLATGEFEGTLVARNIHASGDVREAPPLNVSFVVLPSAIAAFGPAAASRQQRVRVAGNGFVALESARLSTELRFRGTFEGRDGESEQIDESVAVRVEASDRAIWAPSPQEVDELLVGLGSRPGTFTGTVTPVVLEGNEELAGVAWRGSFEILPAKQVVHVKFTPQFPEALRLFGLRNVDAKIRERVLEVLRRDYAGFNLDFRTEKPTDFEHWTTVELTGDDPNEADLFGLDNTKGKDAGNLRLNDYVGGKNAEQLEEGAFAYGGVFLASFLRFSPNVCRRENPDTGILEYKYCRGGSQFPLASQRFDDVFAPFSSLLNGTEAALEELSSGARKDQLATAIRVLGNVAGNTVTHELGHSLGLAQEIGLDEYHNPGDTYGWIMNPGGSRPFEERAELDGQGPGVWAPADEAYLREILPTD